MEVAGSFQKLLTELQFLVVEMSSGPNETEFTRVEASEMPGVWPAVLIYECLESDLVSLFRIYSEALLASQTRTIPTFLATVLSSCSPVQLLDNRQITLSLLPSLCCFTFTFLGHPSLRYGLNS